MEKIYIYTYVSTHIKIDSSDPNVKNVIKYLQI